MSRRVRLLATVAAGGLALTGLAAVTPSATAAAPQAKWTVMVYMSGDNNLEDYVVKDLELELGGGRARTQTCRSSRWPTAGPATTRAAVTGRRTKLYHVTPGMTADAASAVADWGERNMGDKQTLTDFVSWSKANYPADHYALYFWGHGWSWHPGWVMEDDTSNDTLDYDETKAAIPSLGLHRRGRVRRLQHGLPRDHGPLARTRHRA